jgi:hypothetical protein
MPKLLQTGPIKIRFLATRFLILLICLSGIFQCFVISQPALSLIDPQTKTVTTQSRLAGPIVSVQFSHDGTASWIISGRWRVDVGYDTKGLIPLSLRNLNVSLVVVSIDGSNTYRYKISDLIVQSSSYSNKTNFSISKGTVSILAEQKTLNNVPISIKIINNKIIMFILDVSQTNTYFGESPIYGVER